MSAAHILVVDDEADIRNLLNEILTEEGYSVSVAADAAQARSERARRDPDLVLLDIWMPDTDGITLLREWSESGRPQRPVIMMSGHGTVETAVEATRLGAFDFVEKPVSLKQLLYTVERGLESRRMSGRRQRIGERLSAPMGKSAAMHELRDQVRQVAAQDSNVLLVGEAGTGREAFARYLHDSSPRASAPMVSIAASVLTAANADVQLFAIGPEPGLVPQAQGGTLFINEIEDLDPQVQKLLLGALEMDGYTAPGESQPRALDIRLVTSGSPRIDVAVRDGRMRADLVALLGVFRLRVPPLREYSEDVPELLRYYVDKLVDEQQLPLRRFSVAAQNRLRNYPWPGNVRELKNIVNRLLVLGDDAIIDLEEVEKALSAEAPPGDSLVQKDLLALPLREAREEFERAYLRKQLELCGGKVGQLAKRVGMERTHLYRKLRSLGVEFGQS